MPRDASTENVPAARLMAGVPATNNALYHRVRFAVGDPAALVELPEGQSLFIVRDIEMDRAREKARADRVACPADFVPAGGLSGDRETATAQAVAECLRREGVERVVADRTLPLIFAHQIALAGIAVECDPAWGTEERRAKDALEIAALREAQAATEEAMRRACEMVARAEVGDEGLLLDSGQPLTAERVRTAIDIFLLERGYTNSGSIVAGGGEGGDCHNLGHGPLRTAEPVIVDIFPRSRATRYHGDCTRTVVHGLVPPEVARMHAAVTAAKRAATAAVRPGVTGESVHQATVEVMRQHGYPMGLPPTGAADDYTSMPHGTGHGLGLDVHEPPLLDHGGPVLVVGDALTIEPGLYSRAHGGVRVEDLVIVTPDGCENVNRLPEGLGWA